MNSLTHLLNGAGVGSILHGGYRDPAKFMKAMLSKQKHQANPYSREHIKAPFVPASVDNPSLFIQQKYKDKPHVRFDYIKAAENQDARDRGEEDDVARIMMEQNVGVDEAIRRWDKSRDLKKEVMTPEYWGLSWDDLEQKGNWWVNPDGLRFPPIPWYNSADGKTYWGLACCGGEPEAGKKKQRYKMLYFKEGASPDLSQRQFERTAMQNERIRLVDDGSDEFNKVKKADQKGYQYDPEKEDEKTYKGVSLKGTNLTLAKTPAEANAAAKKAKRTRGGRRKLVPINITTERRSEIRTAIDNHRGIITTKRKKCAAEKPKEDIPTPKPVSPPRLVIKEKSAPPSPPPEEEEEEEAAPVVREATAEEKAQFEKTHENMKWYLKNKIVVMATLVLERHIVRHLTPAEYEELTKLLQKNLISFLLDSGEKFLRKLGFVAAAGSDSIKQFGGELNSILMSTQTLGSGSVSIGYTPSGDIIFEYDRDNYRKGTRLISNFKFKLPLVAVWKERYGLEGEAPKPAEPPKAAPKPAEPPKAAPKPAAPAGVVRRRPRNEAEAIAVYRVRAGGEPTAVEKQILTARDAWGSPVSLYKLADEFKNKYSSANYSGINRLFGKFGLVGNLLPELPA
jgi:hypothetical protein